MREFLNTLLRPVGNVLRSVLGIFEGVLDRVLGVFGGLVCAFAASCAAYYVCAVFDWHILWFIGASMASVFLCALMGLLFYRYFVCFIIPVFNFIGNADAGPHDPVSHDGSSWLQFFAIVGFLLALIALVVGALFQLHLVFAWGAIVFLVYAIAGPVVFPTKQDSK